MLLQMIGPMDVILGILLLVRYGLIYRRIGRNEMLFQGLFQLSFGIYAFFVYSIQIGWKEEQRIGAYSALCFLLFPVFYAFFVYHSRKRAKHSMIQIPARIVLLAGVCSKVGYYFGLWGKAADDFFLFAVGLYSLGYQFYLIGEEAELLNGQKEVTRETITPINYHFLFNTLNNLITLIRKDPQEACDAVYALAKYLRTGFAAREAKGLISFEDELTQIRAYLCLEEKRFPGRIVVDMKLAKTKFMLPPLSVQSIVEMCIRYGLSKVEKNAMLSLQTYDQGACVCVVIALEGQYFPKITENDKQELAQKIDEIRRRILQLPGASMEIEDRGVKGVRMIYRIPRR